MPRLRDPEAHASEKRALIIAEAIKVFGEKGYHAANIADIAQRLGLGHGTFYRYFKNKLDIYDAIVDMTVSAISELVTSESATASSSLDDYRAQLGRIGQRFVAIFTGHRRLAQLIFHEGLIIDPVIGKKISQVLDLFARFTEAYLENGKQKGFLRADLDTSITARAINAMIFESIHHIAHDNDPNAMATRWQGAIISLMLDGMRSR